MALQDSDSRIQGLTDEFVSQLSELIREAAFDAVRSAIEGAGGSAAPKRGKKKASRKKAARKATGGAKKRTRRTPADYSALGDEILTYVKTNPGCGAGDIASAVGSTTGDIRPVTAGLLSSKKLRTTGQKRGTKYFAGGGGAKKAPGKKAGRRSAS